MGEKSSADAGLEARSIITTREFDTPRELVWEAWTDPKHLSKWWGPTGFTTTTSAFDMSPGGVWRFVMHGPDGRDYQNRVVFKDIVRPERLTYSHGDADKELFKVDVTFEDIGGRTRLTMHAVFPTVEAREFVAKEHKAVEGAQQTLGRLAQYVATMS